ncbi:hypothetical protein M6B38_374180 [Iris pallida]|uniref:Uncharacterized protein n=1 Tax=Iris pallida TaxID=29817 RepID=A0AAX6GCK9_IRIPA|nr:hypothetical protein M6B38_374180 [Iris pallida]
MVYNLHVQFYIIHKYVIKKLVSCHTCIGQEKHCKIHYDALNRCHVYAAMSISLCAMHICISQIDLGFDGLNRSELGIYLRHMVEPDSS